MGRKPTSDQAGKEKYRQVGAGGGFLKTARDLQERRKRDVNLTEETGGSGREREDLGSDEVDLELRKKRE